MWRRALWACAAVATIASCGGSQSPYAAPKTSAGVATGRDAGGFQTERLWGDVKDTRWEPVVAADRSSSWVYQMTTDQRPDYLLFRASNDGGRTWQPSRHICRHGTRVPFQYDPQVAVDGSGTVDVVCLNGFRPGITFTQSHDHGQTWSYPAHLDGKLRYGDKPILDVSASGRDLYVAFNSYYGFYVSASHDGGTTWQAPVRATTRRLWYYPYDGTVAPDGSVWFAVDGESGKNQTGGGRYGLVRSTDGGATWSVVSFGRTHEGAPCTQHNCYPDFYTAQDAIAVDSSGTYVYVYAANDHKQGPNSLYARTSNDGIAWSAPVTLDAAGNSTSPAIAAGPSPGDFRLVWQNGGASGGWNTWYARSTDGGATWTTPLRLSNRGGGAPYKHAGGYDFPFGDYLGLSVDAQGCNDVVWGEGSAIYYPGGTWWTRGPGCK